MALSNKGPTYLMEGGETMPSPDKRESDKRKQARKAIHQIALRTCLALIAKTLAEAISKLEGWLFN